jgi:uncharacterized RDD family membrane protein YckC
MNAAINRAGLAVRGVEALIDLVVVLVILYLVAVATGHTTEDGFGFDLPTGPTLIGVVLSLAYFILLEGFWGATLGKIATNLRVVRESDGEAIDWSAAIIRNLFRVIDGIVLYILGFIVICLTRKHQRLGDLVAGTIVVRRSPQPAPVSTRAA